MTDRDGLPTKLQNDAILEAGLEIRFGLDPAIVSEIFIGRFADSPAWREFRHARLQSADIPEQLRRLDPNLRYLPSIEVTSQDGGTVLRIGPQSVLYARRGHYPGWEGGFGPELRDVSDQLYRVLPACSVERLGLRYVNALRSDLHGIGSVRDLAINIAVGEQPLDKSLNLNFKTNVGSEFETMTRIASIDLAEGAIPDNARVVVDIDVYTTGTFAASDSGEVKNWIEKAHEYEKIAFFKVLGGENTARLRER